MYLLPQYFVYIYISTTFYYMHTQKVKNNLEYTSFFTDSYQNTKNTAAFAKDLIAPPLWCKGFCDAAAAVTQSYIGIEPQRIEEAILNHADLL